MIKLYLICFGVEGFWRLLLTEIIHLVDMKMKIWNPSQYRELH